MSKDTSVVCLDGSDEDIVCINSGNADPQYSRGSIEASSSRTQQRQRYNKALQSVPVGAEMNRSTRDDNWIDLVTLSDSDDEDSTNKQDCHDDLSVVAIAKVINNDNKQSRREVPNVNDSSRKKSDLDDKCAPTQKTWNDDASVVALARVIKDDHQRSWTDKSNVNESASRSDLDDKCTSTKKTWKDDASVVALARVIKDDHQRSWTDKLNVNESACRSDRNDGNLTSKRTLHDDASVVAVATIIKYDTKLTNDSTINTSARKRRLIEHSSMDTVTAPSVIICSDNNSARSLEHHSLDSDLTASTKSRECFIANWINNSVKFVESEKNQKALTVNRTRPFNSVRFNYSSKTRIGAIECTPAHGSKIAEEKNKSGIGSNDEQTAPKCAAKEKFSDFKRPHVFPRSNKSPISSTVSPASKSKSLEMGHKSSSRPSDSFDQSGKSFKAEDGSTDHSKVSGGKMSHLDREKSSSSSFTSHQSSQNSGPSLEANDDIQTSLDKFVDICKKILPTSEFAVVSKKLLKYYNKIVCSLRVQLTAFIDTKVQMAELNQKNIYIHIRDVIEKMKQLQTDDRHSERSAEVSDTSLQAKEHLVPKQAVPAKKRVSFITISTSEHMKKGKSENENMIEGTSLAPKSPVSKEEQAKVPLSSDIVMEKKIETAQVQCEKLHPPPDEIKCRSPSSVKKVKNVSQNHIRKLERALELCAKKIKKLEDAPVDFENENESTYMLQARYKRRYMDIYAKLGEYREKPLNLERRLDKPFSFKESQLEEVNRKIEKFINKTKQFPDFVEIKELVQEVNKKEELNLSESKIHAEAERLFQCVGQKLKSRRGDDDLDSIYSYLGDQDITDPAVEDKELSQKLLVQGKEGKKKLDQVFARFAELQAKNISEGVEESIHEDLPVDSTTNEKCSKHETSPNESENRTTK